MARYKVILIYDGTAFHGMQRQASDRTVQGEVEGALRKIGWQGNSLTAAGRTDQGVHASGQVIAFDLDWRHSHLDLQNALNAALPADVSVKNVETAAEGFHPRYDAAARIYRYQIFCQPQRDPLRERYAWRVWPALDFDQLKKAASQLPGSHDFAAFGRPLKPNGPTTRNVFSAEWVREGQDALAFVVSANAFLYHMVRRMVLIQVEIGQGRYPVEVITEYLTGQRHGMIQGLAPPQGLHLEQVLYE